jgi:hypothetical protein
LEGWHPRNAIPQTDVRREQQERTAAPELKWLAGYLESGVLDFQHPMKPDRVSASSFYAHARSTVKGLSYWSDHDFAKFLEKWGVTQKLSNGAWRVFPPLEDMRAEWAKRNPGWGEFDPKATHWAQETVF